MQDKRLGASGEPWEPRVPESRQFPKVQPMLRTILTALAAFASLAALPNVAQARLQCVTYARQVSDVQLSGNARDWWGNAAGTYARGQEPKAGAVLAFRASRAMPYGHVAVVSCPAPYVTAHPERLSARLLHDQAPWQRHSPTALLGENAYQCQMTRRRQAAARPPG